MTGKQTKTYPRKRKTHEYKINKGIGKFKCNICEKKYIRYSKFDRFCNSCRSRI